MSVCDMQFAKIQDALLHLASGMDQLTYKVDVLIAALSEDEEAVEVSALDLDGNPAGRAREQGESL